MARATPPPFFGRVVLAALAFAVVVGGCADTAAEADPVATVAIADPPTTATAPSTPSDDGEAATSDRFPTVVGAEATLDGDGTWHFDVTISSPYDTPERYADAWRIVDSEGNELGIRVLAHDHAGEQPFTRSLSGVVIPAELSAVRVEPRDLVNGWSGETVTVELEENGNG